LMHELGHIKRGDGIKNHLTAVDVDLVGSNSVPVQQKPKHEIAADALAANWLVPQDELEGFIRRTRPRYSKVRIKGFADSIEVHPGIVVGQLQHRGEIGYSANREMLENIRPEVTDAALTDGWGTTLSATI
ncbi:MAG: ImmA/IrrE family metallo-endopeptidase, partial [Chloroflexi bacterium]|nr:ImmA/IrrE family metallo-endopeptidase [Chloroflexota bacterium]